jgi:hypothetical protein
MTVEQYNNAINYNKHWRKNPSSKVFRKFITTIALPTLLLLLTIISAAPADSVQATGWSNETEAIPAPVGAWYKTILTLISFLIKLDGRYFVVY